MICVWFDLFWTPKNTFINTNCQQFLAADRFKRPFLAYISHKNSKLIIFSAYLVCIPKVNKWVKFDL